jgi:hypothetical protein
MEEVYSSLGQLPIAHQLTPLQYDFSFPPPNADRSPAPWPTHILCNIFGDLTRGHTMVFRYGKRKGAVERAHEQHQDKAT